MGTPTPSPMATSRLVEDGLRGVVAGAGVCVCVFAAAANGVVDEPAIEDVTVVVAVEDDTGSVLL